MMARGRKRRIEERRDRKRTRSKPPADKPAPEPEPDLHDIDPNDYTDRELNEWLAP